MLFIVVVLSIQSCCKILDFMYESVEMRPSIFLLQSFVFISIVAYLCPLEGSQCLFVSEAFQSNPLLVCDVLVFDQPALFHSNICLLYLQVPDRHFQLSDCASTATLLDDSSTSLPFSSAHFSSSDETVFDSLLVICPRSVSTAHFVSKFFGI